MSTLTDVEKRGKRQMDVSDYYKRCADLTEKIRYEIGHGYGENDIERIATITITRLREWNRLDKQEAMKGVSDRMRETYKSQRVESEAKSAYESAMKGTYYIPIEEAILKERQRCAEFLKKKGLTNEFTSIVCGLHK